jgi:hypothetical protein
VRSRPAQGKRTARVDHSSVAGAGTKTHADLERELAALRGDTPSEDLPTGPAPDVTDLRVGNYDPNTEEWGDVLEYETTKQFISLDYSVKAPLDVRNWSGCRAVFRIPEGDDFTYHRDDTLELATSFNPPAPGGTAFYTLGLGGKALPPAGTLVRLYVVSLNRLREENTDADGRPTGPYVEFEIPELDNVVNFDRPGKVTNLSMVLVPLDGTPGMYEATVEMDRPDDGGVASGVQLYLEAPSGTRPRDVGSFDFVGEAVRQVFTFRIEGPRGAAEQWKLHAPSYSPNYAGPLVTSGANAAPFVTVIVGTLAVVDEALEVVNSVIKVRSKGITRQLIEDFAIAQQQLDAAAVATENMKPGAVTEVIVGGRAITALKLGLLAVETANLALAAVGTAQIKTAAITTLLVADAAITDAKIGSLSANKITAGTITAVVRMTAPEIDITSSFSGDTQRVLIDGTNSVMCRTTATSYRYAQLYWAGLLVGRSDDTFQNTTVTIGAVRCRNSIHTASLTATGTTASLDVTSLGVTTQSVRIFTTETEAQIRINNLPVLGPRQPAIANPTAGATADFECRITVGQILNVMRTHGLIFT